MRRFGNITKIIHEGNFVNSSRQMEHAILIDLLEQVTPLLEEYDIMLDVTADGDLDTNKTLAGIPIVHQVYADLKHITRNIRKNLSKSENAKIFNITRKYSIYQKKIHTSDQQ
jgi:pyruvate-formate lyase-activating enzyme